MSPRKQDNRKPLSTGSSGPPIVLLPPKFVPITEEQERQAVRALADIFRSAIAKAERNEKSDQPSNDDPPPSAPPTSS